jgi:ribonucleoside-diphosphate reductase alpha chain|tara:strand:- start:36098 stop:37864 length:1767 start_codon:yes stop_codon:yes gene_type:complete
MVHAEKYRGEGETFREACNREASALQDSHEHYMAYRDARLHMRYMSAGRVQAAMGSLKNITPYNCFVMPRIHDSFTDGPSLEELEMLSEYEHPPLSIMDTAKSAAITMRQGGGVGYDITPLRPRGDLIKGVQSFTDGPMAFAPIYNAVCNATASAGNRRGAQMLVMRCDHPDIEIFIRAKQGVAHIPYEYRPLRGFNMSVAVTDELIECVQSGKPFPLKWGGQVYREVDPHALWEMIMRGTYDWAEPGVLFIDTINRMNNLWYCETIAATNPCGEQPLPPYGACLLGSINLPRYLHKNAAGQYEFQWELLAADIPNINRAMDNVIDRARYPLPEQKAEAQNKRRIGIGVTGLANCIEALGHLYGTPGFLELEDKILKFITRNLYISSAMLAKEKGSFPFYDEEKYLASEFIQTLDSDVQDLIRKYGIRNSHLTSIAPTGTISFTADNVSSGCEPVFGYTQSRRVIMPEGRITVEVPDYGASVLGVKGKRAMDVTAQEHVAVLCTAQRHIDSAVSKTCNVPSDYPYDKFKDLYMQAFEGGAKGCTTYRPNGNYEDVITSADKAEEGDSQEAEACGFDPVTGQRTGACAE